MDDKLKRALVDAGYMGPKDYAMSKEAGTADPVPSFRHPVPEGATRCLQIVEAENAALKDENQRLRIRLQTISDLANAALEPTP